MRGPLMNFPNYQDFPFVWGPISKIPKVFFRKMQNSLDICSKIWYTSVSTPEREGNSKMKQVPKNKRYHKNNKRQLNSEWRVRMCGFVSSRSHRIEKMERKEFKLGTVLAAV